MGAASVTNDFLCVCSPEEVGQNPSFVALNNNYISCCQIGVITKHWHFMPTVFGVAGGCVGCLQCCVSWQSPGCDKWRSLPCSRSVYPPRAGGELGRAVLLHRCGVTLHLINLIVGCCSNGWSCSFGFHPHPEPHVFCSFPLNLGRTWVMVCRKCCLH